MKENTLLTWKQGNSFNPNVLRTYHSASQWLLVGSVNIATTKGFVPEFVIIRAKFGMLHCIPCYNLPHVPLYPEDIWGSRSTAPCILKLIIKKRAVVSFTLWLLYFWEKSLWFYWTRGLMGLTAGLKVVDKEEFPCPCQKLNPDSLVVQPIV
jgi:hypothetical protein